ncbi:hypothetical protein B566_EDAN010646 [Ephemera danica]|nr:hypothetical protein B566_EDAN010646 [Ephemera danica]
MVPTLCRRAGARHPGFPRRRPKVSASCRPHPYRCSRVAWPPSKCREGRRVQPCKHTESLRTDNPTAFFIKRQQRTYVYVNDLRTMESSLRVRDGVTIVQEKCVQHLYSADPRKQNFLSVSAALYTDKLQKQRELGNLPVEAVRRHDVGAAYVVVPTSRSLHFTSVTPCTAPGATTRYVAQSLGDLLSRRWCCQQLALQRSASDNSQSALGHAMDTNSFKMFLTPTMDQTPVVVFASRFHSNMRDEDGLTPTLWAAFCGHYDVLRIFISRGGDPSKADRLGNTGLHLAAFGGHTHCVGFLISMGQNVWAMNVDARTPRDLAAASPNGDISLRLLDSAMAKELALDPKKVRAKKQRAQQRARKLNAEYRNVSVFNLDPENAPRRHSDASLASSTATGATSGSMFSVVRLQALQRGRRASANSRTSNISSSSNVSNASLGTQYRHFQFKVGTMSRSSVPLESVTDAFDLAQQTQQENVVVVSPPADSDSENEDPTEVYYKNDNLEEVQEEEADDDDDDEERSPLQAFVTAWGLPQLAPQLTRLFRGELEALLSVAEDDLRLSGIPLGPRKKLLRAIEEHNRIIESPPALEDAETKL